MSQQKTNESGFKDSSETFRAPLPPPSNLSATNLIKSIRASKPPNETNTNISKNTNGSQVLSSRVSKFSDHPPQPAGVTAAQACKMDAVAAAAAAAAKINANLRAKGKLADQTLLKPVVSTNTNLPLSLIKIAETKKVFNSYIAKIDINDLPLSSRTYFTQVSVQETINKQTGVAISTKGQYLTPDEKKHLDGIEKQLHLFIQSPSQEKTDLALAKLKDMISKQKPPSLPVITPSVTPVNKATIRPLPIGQPSLPTGNFIQEKVFIGMDFCVPEFDLKTKLTGVNYANFNFIANSTGAKVILRGRGSGFIEPTSGREAFESMYVFITHPNQIGVEAAKKLIYNLISTINSDYNSYIAKKMNPPAARNFSLPSQFADNSNSQMPINPYNNVIVSSTNSYPVNSYTNNLHSAPSPSFTKSLYSNTDINAYGPQASDSSYNLPPSNTNAPSTTVESAIPETKVSNNASEWKAKRRRFQEEQPDDSNVLGYKQYSSQNDLSNVDCIKRQRKSSPTDKSAKVVHESRTSNLPFWMSHD